MLNEKTITVKMKRIDLCDLLLATTCLAQSTEGHGKKWELLHDMLKAQLEDLDKKHADEI